MRSRSIWAMLAVLAAVVAAAVVVGAASAKHQTSFQINVDAREFKFHLGRTGVPKGYRVVFHIINHGKLPHDFKIAGKKSPLIPAGRSANLIVTFTKKGSYPYLCTVPGHAAAGMKGVFHVF